MGAREKDTVLNRLLEVVCDALGTPLETVRCDGVLCPLPLLFKNLRLFAQAPPHSKIFLCLVGKNVIGYIAVEAVG